MENLVTNLKGKWNVLKGKAQQKWAEVNENDFSGDEDRESFIAKIERKTDEAREDIEKWYDRQIEKSENWRMKLKGEWNELKGKAQQKWAELSEEDLDNEKNEYDRDTFIHMVVKKTNETKENVENWFDKQFEKK